MAGRARSGLLVLVAAFGSRSARAQHPSALELTARAMGGKERVLGVRTLVVEGTGELLYFGQTRTPDARTVFTVTAFKRSYDFANRRWQLDQTREARFQTPMPPPTRLRSGLDGDVGYSGPIDGPAARVPAGTVANWSAEFIQHPIGFIQAASAPGNRVVEDRAGRILLTAGETTFTMELDPRTRLPSRISRPVDHPMLGDVRLEVELSDWREVDGLLLPMRIAQRQLRWVLSDYRFTSARTNGELGNLAAGDSLRATAAPAPSGGMAPEIAVEELAPGLWLLTGPAFNGGLYHTVAIEQSNRIVLVEAPDNDARTLAVIAKARTLRPGKPLGPMVNTHHHFDHAGGVRAAISEGLTIVTHRENGDFYRRAVYPGRHTIRPDSLQVHRKPLRLVTVGRKLVLRDPLRSIELHALEGGEHSGSMLIAYLPAERTVIQADLDKPRGPDGEDPDPPFDSTLIENVRRLGLRVDRVVGIHGRPLPWPNG
jgi:glyoxylase-like metal-dependent hydrolase (beta-lactamase superfamily II)